MDKVRKEILSELPPHFAGIFSGCDFKNLCEIRFRAGRPVMLYYSCSRYYCRKDGGISKYPQDALICSADDITKLILSFCKSSIYAHQEEIKEGFITIKGGHRVGICGTAVTENGNVINVKSFSGVNIRIAKEFINCADRCMKHICDGKRIYNTVIISPPGVGKTTVLRDITRQLSKSYKVSVIDERSEIAACFMGVPQFDVGEQTDVYDGFPKPWGITCALRSLSPEVIITDEIGTDEDIWAIKKLLKGGCRIITTMHGYSIDETREKKRELLKLFERAVLLERKNGVPEAVECVKL